jgi:peptidoglycan hydrolase-like protein with peptidoglycan-binding domain
MGRGRVGATTAAAFAALVVLGALPLTSSASTTAPRLRVARAAAIGIASPDVLPGTPVAITVSTTPAQAGRIVLLRAATGRRLRNVGYAMTGARGIATFTRTFSALGTVRLRAEVIATGLDPEILSPMVQEQVVAVLPFVLPAGAPLVPGDSGPAVAALQTRLSALGYWLGAPGGYFGDATEQAVYALEKTAGLPRTGVVDGGFVAALNADDVPVPRTTTGNAIDVDLERDLVEIVKNGHLFATLNTSTGGGYIYTEDGVSQVATTPRGIFSTDRVVDGTVVDSLGTLWRPRFFVGGYAIHGDTSVPPFPESHGCVRVSDAAIDWIWANNLDPIGMTVWVY